MPLDTGKDQVDEKTCMLKKVQTSKYNRTSQQQNLEIFGDEDEKPSQLGTDFEAKRLNEGCNSMIFTSAILINSIIGGSLISMPFVLREAGLILGGALILLVALVTAMSLVLQIGAGCAAGTNTFHETAEVLFGRPGYVVCALLQFLLSFIILIGDYIIVGDTAAKLIVRMTSLDPRSVFVRREFINGLATLFLTVPLSLKRDLACLAKASFLSLGLVIFTAASMIARAPMLAPLMFTYDSRLVLFERNFGPAASITAVAYVCHHASFMIHRSLENNTIERWTTTTHIALGTSTLIYLAVAAAGYVTFRGLTQGDILENYCWNDDLMNVCRLLSCVTSIISFPVDCLSAREVVETSCFRHSENHSFARKVVLTLAIITSALLLSFTTDCLAFLLQVIGVFVTCPLAFILPGLCALKTTSAPLFSKETSAAWAIISFGVFSSACGLVTMIVNVATIAHCSHGLEMPYCLSAVNSTVFPAGDSSNFTLA